jgi:hypothetical protein
MYLHSLALVNGFAMEEKGAGGWKTSEGGEEVEWVWGHFFFSFFDYSFLLLLLSSKGYRLYSLYCGTSPALINFYLWVFLSLHTHSLSPSLSFAAPGRPTVQTQPAVSSTKPQ